MKKLIHLFLLFTLLLSFSLIHAQKTKKTDTRTYKVVINHEEQYAIWPAGKAAASGWKDTKKTGSFLTCEEYLNRVWTDMRPLSIRNLNLPHDTRYQVVINHEEQYSIWPASRKAPKEWKSTGKQGSLKACRKYIEEVWTDMRPLSLRK